MDDLDKMVIYYYRNDFPLKYIMEKTGLTLNQVNYKIRKFKKQGILKRWWEE